MKFVDEATIVVEAGKGGNGSRSFRREKFIPFGGPDGGDGGRGGSIYLEGHSSLNTLVDFRYVRRIKAEDGDCGHGQKCSGKQGLDQIVRVPVGTLVYDGETDECLGDVVESGQKLLVARGGSSGLGNIHFKTSTNRSPKHATAGKPGDVRTLKLELKLLADVGLLGLPNAGKSTFLRAVSAAKPKVADYPFTTLNPHLGTVRIGQGQSFVIADIPGIIEGAHEGAGLGLQFLRHLSRTGLLLHCVDIAPYAELPVHDAIPTIVEELRAFAPELVAKPRWLVLNKSDQQDEAAIEELQASLRALYPEQPMFVVSSVAQHGLKELLYAIWKYLEDNRVVEELPVAAEQDEDVLFEQNEEEVLA